MCLDKTVRLALEGFERLSALRAERQRNASAANRGTCPRDSVELDHARAIRECASTMLAKGYRVHLHAPAPDKPLEFVKLTGPTNYVWAGDDLRELLNECPEYATVSDYALAVHEQYQE